MLGEYPGPSAGAEGRDFCVCLSCSGGPGLGLTLTEEKLVLRIQLSSDYLPWAFSKLDSYFFPGGKIETEISAWFDQSLQPLPPQGTVASGGSRPAWEYRASSP